MNTKIFSFRFLAISAFVIVVAMLGITAAFAEGGVFGGARSSAAITPPAQTADLGSNVASPSELTRTPQPMDDKDGLKETPRIGDDSSSQTSTPQAGLVCAMPGMDLSRSSSEAEFYGAIEAIVDGEYTIMGLQVVINTATEVKGNFVSGDFVKVHATLQADGSYLAREIELAAQCQTSLPASTALPISATSSSSSSSEWEFYGRVDGISGNLWTIGGNVVRVDANTEFRGSPVVGSFVEVKAYRQADGSWLAARIKIED